MRIGFVTLSGLRLVNAPLLEMGLSFPAISRRAAEIAALPNLGLLTLAGMTPRRIDVEYLEVPDANSFEAPSHFDAVAITALSATAKESYQLAAKFRAHGTQVIIGGLHATLAPVDVKPHADAVAIGEGEMVWPEILADLERGTLKSVYDARAKGFFDLRKAPMPSFHLLDSARKPRFTVQTQRGCPLSCEFCASSMRLSPFKTKPVSKVIAEISALRQRFPNAFIEFADDNTFVNRRHARELMKALRPLGVRWFAESDLSIAEDEELLKMMREAGCAQVLIGFESPDFAALDGVELNSNWKARRAEQACRAVEKIQRQGITVCGCFVMGLDGSGPECFNGVMRFVRDSGLYDVQITYLTPFPSTPLFHRLSEAGRLLAEDSTERCTLFDINFEPSHMTRDQLEGGFQRLAARLYKPEFVEQRKQRFFGHLKQRVLEDRHRRFNTANQLAS
ncbi:MAG: B12-binding domain-containing radical SAM protein [Verrucomicrobiae bacterium]|nr:B12-binding domain-containing radical SAM protein [Verrucomicrobiae bacterium]